MTRQDLVKCLQLVEKYDPNEVWLEQYSKPLRK